MDQLFLLWIFLIVGGIAITVAILRWALRINERFNQNEEIIRLLKKMAGERDED